MFHELQSQIGHRPMWRADQLGCPVVRLGPSLNTDGQGQGLLPPTASALNSGTSYAMEQAMEDSRARSQLVKLIAAVWRDYGGLNYEGVRALLRDQRPVDHRSFAGDRELRRLVSDGRALWTALGAWPWAAHSEKNFQNWWTKESVVKSWDRWRSAPVSRW